MDLAEKPDTKGDRNNSTDAAMDPTAAPKGLKGETTIEKVPISHNNYYILKTVLKLRCQPTSGRLHSAIYKKCSRYPTLEEAKKKAKLQKKKRIVNGLNYFLTLHTGGNSTQTVLLYKIQQTQLSVLGKLQLFVRRMLVMFQRSITLLSALMFLPS